MHNPIKQAFETIVAEKQLKANTIAAIYSDKIHAKSHQKVRQKKMFAVAASFFVLFIGGSFSMRLYHAPAATVSIDTNPAIELTLNQFDTVVDVYSYNEDGNHILQNLNLKYKKCDDAMATLLDTLASDGYLMPESLLSVTVQTQNTAKEKALLSELDEATKSAMKTHHAQSELEIYPVSSSVSSYAHSLNVSPAKYIAITELQKIDEGVTVETCRNHTIKELKQMTQQNETHTHQEMQASQPPAPSEQMPANTCQGGHGHRHGQQNCQQ